MDDEDYRALIEIVAEELRLSGVPDIADERHYQRTDPETGDAHLVEPQKRLIEMLRAFDRHVSVRDGALVEQSLRAIRDMTRGEGPRHAVIALANDAEAREIDLGEAPDMREVRVDLNSLIARLSDFGFRSDEDDH